MPNKLFCKKRKQINRSKQKANIRETSTQKVIINSLDSFDKKKLPVLILVIKTSKPKAQNIDIAMIAVDAYCIDCYLQKGRVFVILIKDILYQAKKKAKAETDPNNVVPQKYHNFLDCFSKKNSDTLSLYQKYDHKIYLEKK